MDDVARARELLRDAGRVAVLTGAGISTASGIGDYRGPQGRWTLDPDAERVSTLSWYLNDPDVRARAWRYRAESPVYTAEPNAAHRALTVLERGARLPCAAWWSLPLNCRASGRISWSWSRRMRHSGSATTCWNAR